MFKLKTLFIFNTIVSVLLSIYFLPIYQRHKNNPAVRYTIYFIFFYTLGLILFILRNQIPDFLSIVVATTLCSMGSVSLYLGTKSALKLDAKWSLRYWIPVGIIFVGFYTFTFIVFDSNMRAIIFATFALIYSILSGWLFFNSSSKRFKTFDKLSVWIFALGAVIFAAIIIRLHFQQLTPYVFSNIDFFIYLQNLDLLLIDIWIVIFVKYRILNKNII